MTTTLLNAFYEFGDKIGPFFCWVFVILMFIELVIVMSKYLGTPKK